MNCHPNVAPGIHRVDDAFTNWYLVETGEALTVVDAGVPTSWGSLQKALRSLGRSCRDVRAVVLTHAHFDHIGFAERARATLGIPVYVHENDVPLTRKPLLYGRERNPLRYFATQIDAAPIVLSLLRSRAFWPKPIQRVERFSDGTIPGLDARVVATPGHTLGHVALHFPDRDAVIAGDAVVMLDPYTAQRGPRLVARAATADSQRALASLDAIAETGARLVLTGHGEPWTSGAEAAVEQARKAGIA
jgi:glyoxylase-like metal-dependent hydrolase (beta-lactamase superfamily II)